MPEMPDVNGRLTTQEIVDLIQVGGKVEVEFTHSHAGTILQFGPHAVLVDVGSKPEIVTSPAKARQIGEALIAWADFKES